MMKNKQVLQCDVLVVGAGISGVCAAAAAAGSGAGVILVEQDDFVGGTAVTDGLTFICGLYHNPPVSPELLNAGSSRDIVARLIELDGLARPRTMGKVYVLPVQPKNLETTLWGLLDPLSGLKVLLNTKVVKAGKSVGNVSVVICSRKNRFLRIEPKAVVDCSGDAVLARSAAGDYFKSPAAKRQLAGYTFKVKGLRAFDESLNFKVPYYVAGLLTKRRLPAWLKFTTFIGAREPGQGYLRLNLPLVSGNRDSLARRYAGIVHDYLAGCLTEFKQSVIIEKDYRVTDREGARTAGRYLLTAKDVLSARKFVHAEVKAGWPAEFWDPGQGPRYQYIKEAGYYRIPDDCLRSRSFDNLFCAGRCISADPIALASARVMGIAMATGERAGKLAAEYVGKY
jgi:hypothetical protein